ncbi:hypothetical protein ACOMHN_060859 [Nucella lapillus]
MDLSVAKWITLFILLLIPIIVGTLTLYFFIRYKPTLCDSRRGLAFLSYLNCFSGGFFLGTSLLVILSQGLAKFEEYRHVVNLGGKSMPYFEMGIGAGFFLVALIEKLIYLCFAHRHNSEESDQEKIKILPMTQKQSSNTFKDIDIDEDVYEIPADSSQILPETASDTKSYQELNTSELPPSSSSWSKNSQHGGGDNGAGKTTTPSSGGVKNSSEGCGGKSLLQRSVGGSDVSSLRIVMLVLALSFHTVFDGLAVGLQTKVTDVFSLLLAIAVHKAVTSVILGVKLAAVFDDRTPFRPFLALLLFSLTSPLGVAIGVGITSGPVHQSAQLLTDAVLQAMATGVFLYVTCFEILDRDMASRKEGAVTRVLMAILGFCLIAALEILSV